jgi:hypothetical protein
MNFPARTPFAVMLKYMQYKMSKLINFTVFHKQTETATGDSPDMIRKTVDLI